MKLSIKQKTSPVLYHCTSVNRTVIGAKKIEFVLDKIIEISFNEENENEKTYTIQLLGHQLTGSSLMHEWASDMELLQEKLIFKISKAGSIISIENLPEIYVKWHSFFKDKMSQKYKDTGGEGTELMIEQTSKLLKNEEKFLKSFEGFNLYHIFFQGHYEKELQLSNREYLIEGYFGKDDLPLLLNTIIIENEKDNSITLETKGDLDKEKFNQEAFTKHIKGMIGALDVNATLNVELEEKYVFDKKGWLTEADVYLKTHAANMYALANAHIVKQVDQNESKEILKSFNTINK